METNNPARVKFRTFSMSVNTLPGQRRANLYCLFHFQKHLKLMPILHLNFRPCDIWNSMLTFFPLFWEIILHFIYHYLIRKKCCLLGYVGQWWFYLSFYKKAIIKWFANAKEMISNQDHYINFILLCHLGGLKLKNPVYRRRWIYWLVQILSSISNKKKVENRCKHVERCENR